METNMVRQPIMSLNKELVGYELRYQDNGSSLYNQADTRAANVIEDFLVQMNSDRLLDGAVAFLTFTPNLLMKNIPKIFQPERLVIQIEDNSTIHPLAQKIIYRYKKQGYRIAIKGFEFSSRYFALMDVIDIIKMDMSRDASSLPSVMQIGQSFHKTIIAYNVNSTETYEQAKALGCQFFQGQAVAQAMSSAVQRLDHLQSNFFQLVIAITKDEPDIDEITEIISRDVTLAFSLIKLVNSAYFALRNRARSVKQALVVLGLGQLKQWIYLLSFKTDEGDELASELIKTSFLRASFCQELLPYAQGVNISKSEAYLLGMFSTLGTLLSVPLESALSELPIDDEIKLALTQQKGPSGALYRLVLSYENADWPSMSSCAKELGIPENIISQKYFECCESVNNIWRSLTMPYNEEDEELDDNQRWEEDMRKKSRRAGKAAEEKAAPPQPETAPQPSGQTEAEKKEPPEERKEKALQDLSESLNKNDEWDFGDDLKDFQIKF